MMAWSVPQAITVGALIALLPLAGLAGLLWRRLYADDSANPARRVVKNSAVPFATRLLVRALDLLVAVVLFSTLPAADIGPYTLAALLVVQYLGTFTDFGLGVLLTREVARDPGAARRLFGITLLLRLILVLAAIPAAALLLGGYGLLASWGWGEALRPEGQRAVWVLLLALLPGAYSSAVTALYHATERMEVPALIELVTAALGTLARLAALGLGLGIMGLAWAAVMVSTLTALLYLVLQVRHFFRPTLWWDRALVGRLLVLALPLMLNNVLTAVFFRFDTFIIKAFGQGRGDLLVQQYTAAYQVMSIPLLLPPAVTFAVFPLLARLALGERAALARVQEQTMRALFLVAFPAAMGTAVLAPDLIRLLTRRHAADYLPLSAQVLAILAWFLPLSFANGLVQYVLIAVGRQRAITRAFVLGALCNLGLNLLAIPRFGLHSAAAVTILSEVVLFAAFLPTLRQEGLAPRLFALMRHPALAVLPMGLAMLLAYHVHWLVAALVSAPVYALTLWLLGTFGAGERAFLRQLFAERSTRSS